MARDRHSTSITGVGQAGVALLWAIPIAGFVLYLANFDSFDQSFGGAGSTAASILWLAVFSTLYYAAPSMRPAPAGEEGELEGVVRVALADETAHRQMSSLLPGGPGGESGVLSAIECDLNDWGFTYGVAWATAKRRHPGESGERVAERALEAAQRVFSDYCAGEDWSGDLGERRPARETPGSR